MLKMLILLLCCFFLGNAYAALHDPTRPAGSAVASYAPTTSDYKIQQILISGQKKTVMIAGHQLTIGDTYMGLKIIDITPHEIKLRGRRGDFTISMFQSIDKAPVNKPGDKSEKN